MMDHSLVMVDFAALQDPNLMVLSEAKGDGWYCVIYAMPATIFPSVSLSSFLLLKFGTKLQLEYWHKTRAG